MRSVLEHRVCQFTSHDLPRDTRRHDAGRVFTDLESKNADKEKRDEKADDLRRDDTT